MKIQVLGTGCYSCLELEMRLAAAVHRLDLTDITFERVDDEHMIRHHIPLDAVPGLLIDGRLVSQQEVPTVEKLVEWLSAVPT
jgi:hypothetical protein